MEERKTREQEIIDRLKELTICVKTWDLDNESLIKAIAFAMLDFDPIEIASVREFGNVSRLLIGAENDYLISRIDNWPLTSWGSAKTYFKDVSAQLIDFKKGRSARKNGRAGAEARHTPTRKLREWTIEQYRAGKWASANKAAFDLVESVREHGRTIGAHLTRENAQRTIADWIRAANKSV